MPDFYTEIAKFTDKQMEAIRQLQRGRYKFFLYGGALGGGKSYLLRWYALLRSMMLKNWGFKNVPIMLACETYPDLRDRQLSKIAFEWGPEFGRMYDDHRAFGRCFIPNEAFGGNPICFRNLDDPTKYQSSEWACILVDELTKNEFNVFDALRMRLRWPGLPDVECQFVGATNPGSVGHGWVKAFWMDKLFPKEWVDPIDYRPMFYYLPSTADDNPHLTPEYWHMLNTLPKSLRKAFRDGDWNVFVGQAFMEWSPTRHILPRPVWPIPQNAPVYMTYDWGFGSPGSVGWWWVDNDGRIIRFHEWYMWSGSHEPGAGGLRMTDRETARAVKQREEDLRKIGHGFEPNQLQVRLAGRDCFAKRPDYLGGGSGPTTAEEWSKEGMYLTAGDDRDRLQKIKQFRNRLELPDNPIELPMMVVYPDCEQFIRTIPNLVIDKLKVEDVDTKGEDHIYDEACHICMARPITPRPKKVIKTQAQLRVDATEKISGFGNTDEFEEYLRRQMKQYDPYAWNQAQQMQQFYETVRE